MLVIVGAMLSLNKINDLFKVRSIIQQVKRILFHVYMSLASPIHFYLNKTITLAHSYVNSYQYDH